MRVKVGEVREAGRERVKEGQNREEKGKGKSWEKWRGDRGRKGEAGKRKRNREILKLRQKSKKL